jgi:OmpA-OmpF porin, OOP family
MSTTILEAAKSLLTPAVLGQIGSSLGESPEGVSKGMGAVLPALLMGLVTKSGNNDTMGQVMGLLGDKSNAGDFASNLGGLLGGNAAASPLFGIGQKLLSLLFGNTLGGVGNLLGTVTGLKGGAISSLLGLAAPLLMGLLKDKLAGGGVSSLVSLLGAEKSGILSAAPAGLAALLDPSAALKGAASAVTGGADKAVEAASALTGGGGLPKWLLPVLAVAALAGILGYTQCNKAVPVPDAVSTSVPESTNTTTPAPEAAASPAPEASPEASPAPDASPSAVAATTTTELVGVKLPGGVELKGAATGIENQLIGFIQDAAKPIDKTTWFNFDRLLFDTSKATLKPESKEQIDNTVAILKAFPNVSIKIGGYTDNTGNKDGNQKLSTARAETVKNAIIAGGIEAARLESEGYGDQHPVADNATEAGRAQNRRISVRVTKK